MLPWRLLKGHGNIVTSLMSGQETIRRPHRYQIANILQSGSYGQANNCQK